MRDAKPRPGADRIKVAINVFLVALLTRRVFLLDWPDMEPFFHSPYFDWRYGPFNRTLERCVGGTGGRGSLVRHGQPGIATRQLIG